MGWLFVLVINRIVILVLMFNLILFVVGMILFGIIVGFYWMGWWMVISLVLLGKVVLIWILWIILGMLFMYILWVMMVVFVFIRLVILCLLCVFLIIKLVIRVMVLGWFSFMLCFRWFCVIIVVSDISSLFFLWGVRFMLVFYIV